MQEGSKPILSLLLNNARRKHFDSDALKVFRLLLSSYLSTLLSISQDVSLLLHSVHELLESVNRPSIPSVGMEL